MQSDQQNAFYHTSEQEEKIFQSDCSENDDGGHQGNQVQNEKPHEVFSSREKIKLQEVTAYLNNRYGKDLNAKILWVKNKIDLKEAKNTFTSFDQFLDYIAYQSQTQNFIRKIASAKYNTRKIQNIILSYIEKESDYSPEKKQSIKKDIKETFEQFKFDYEDLKQQLKQKYKQLYNDAKKSYKKMKKQQPTGKVQPTQGSKKQFEQNHASQLFNQSQEKLLQNPPQSQVQREGMHVNNKTSNMNDFQEGQILNQKRSYSQYENKVSSLRNNSIHAAKNENKRISQKNENNIFRFPINNLNNEKNNQNLPQQTNQLKNCMPQKKIHSENGSQQTQQRYNNINSIQNTDEQPHLEKQNEQIAKLNQVLNSMIQLRKNLQNKYYEISKQCEEVCQCYQNSDSKHLEELQQAQLGFDDAFHQYLKKSQSQNRQFHNFQQQPSYLSNKNSY
ncbi:hypothetical protein ABPG73_004333 [Tetrahymena malaccensis]